MKLMKILTFNIWLNFKYSSTGLTQLLSIIQKENPDVICLQECFKKTVTNICENLELDHTKHSTWSRTREDIHGNHGLGIICKQEIDTIYDTSEANYFDTTSRLDGFGVKINYVDKKTKKVHPIRIINCHLAWKPYGPELVSNLVKSKQYSSLCEIASSKSTSLSSKISIKSKCKSKIDKIIDKVDKSMGDDIMSIVECLVEHPDLEPELPTIIVGDFNSPSHLDWIYESKSLHFDTVAPWTTTKHLEDIGFNDVYRLQYPSPLNDPGFTWPTSRNNYFKAINDRIDYIFMRADWEIKNIKVIDADYCDINKSVWFSDHNGLLADFAL